MEKRKLFIGMLALTMSMGAATTGLHAEEARVERIGGADRYHTSAEISSKSFKKADSVVVASGVNIADSLTASNLSSRGKMPLLIIEKDKVPAVVEQEMKRLGVKNITIVGGNKSISKNLENKLSEKYNVERISGKDREETSLNVANRIKKEYGASITGIANGYNYADALPSSVYLMQNKGILLLVNKDRINDDVKKEIKENKTVVFGGEKSIPDKILPKSGYERISGKDRYETSMKIYKKIGNGKTVIFTSGNNLVDSLSAVSLSNEEIKPIIYINDENISFVNQDKNIEKIILIGGTSSISKEKEDILKNKSDEKTENKKSSSKKSSSGKTDKDKTDKDKTDKDKTDKEEPVKEVKEKYDDTVVDLSESQDSKVIEMSDDVRKIYIDLMNNYSDLEKKYTNIIESEQKNYKEKRPDEKITVGDIKKLKRFSCNKNNIDDNIVKPLLYAVNLEEFDVQIYKNELKRELSDFSFLKNSSELKKLYYLSHQDSKTEKAGKLGLNSLGKNNKKLEDLRFNATETSDISAIKNLKLKEFSAQENNIEDLSPLKDMESLERLDLENNKIKDLRPLSKLNNLKILYIYGNQIEDLSPLKNLKKLEALLAQSNKIKDIKPLENLNIFRLRVVDNPLKKDYMDEIKKFKHLSNLAVDEINYNDFLWLENLMQINYSEESDDDENNIRQLTFKKLPLTVEVSREKIKNGVIEIDNPIKYGDEYIVQDEYSDINENVEITEDGKIIIKNVDSSQNEVKQSYKIYYEDKEHTYGSYGQPASLEGLIELNIIIK